MIEPYVTGLLWFNKLPDQKATVEAFKKHLWHCYFESTRSFAEDVSETGPGKGIDRNLLNCSDTRVSRIWSLVSFLAL